MPHALDDPETAETVRRILQIVRGELGMDIAFLSEFIGDEQVFQAIEGLGESFGLQERISVLPREQGYCQRMADGRIANVVADVRADAELAALAVTEDAGIGAYVGFPVRLGEGAVFGSLCCLSHAADPELAGRDMQFLQALAGLVAYALERHELHAKMARQQEQLDADLRTAARVQRRLLPREVPALPGLELAAHTAPSSSIGGDYYDHLVDDQGRLVLLVADVAGHSVGPALLMAMARSELRRAVLDGLPPGEVLAAANEGVFEDLLAAESFMTAYCARLDPATGRLEVANAGHNPPLLARGGEARELPAAGPALGLFNDSRFEQHELALEPGDRLLLFTDGIVEARSADRELLGEARLCAVVGAAQDQSAAALNAAVLAEVAAHTGGRPLDDDATLLSLAVYPA